MSEVEPAVGMRLTAAAFEQANKNPLEGPIEDGVNERVNGGRDVTQPETCSHQSVRDVLRSRRPDGHQQVEKEEWGPAQDEPAKYEASKLLNEKQKMLPAFSSPCRRFASPHK